MKALAALGCIGLLLGVGFAEDWSRFRGPNGSGVSRSTGFPVEIGPAKNVVWRAPVRSGKSSPVLTERRVFVTAADKDRLFTQCFDRKSGTLLWERAEARPRAEFGNVRNDPAASTPVTDGENVYAFFADLGAVSYDGDGKLRWKAPLGPFTNTMGVAASPILAESSVVLLVDQNDDSFIAGFDPGTGALRWKAARGEKDGWTTPVLGGGQIVTASRGQLGAHRLSDGTRLWSYDRLSPAIVASPTLDRDVVYTFGYGQDGGRPFQELLDKFDRNHDGVLSADEYGTDPFIVGVATYEGNRDRIITKEEWDGKQRRLVAPSCLIALRLERDGPRELWRQERNFTGVVPSPLVYDGVVYAAKNGGIVMAFDAATGTMTKMARVEQAVGGYSASPVAADGKVWLASEDGHIAVLRAGREWDVLGVNDLGEGCFATPALSRGEIYVRTAAALYCFRSSSESAAR